MKLRWQVLTPLRRSSNAVAGLSTYKRWGTKRYCLIPSAKPWVPAWIVINHIEQILLWIRNFFEFAFRQESLKEALRVSDFSFKKE
jgi:hypothetical protein